jgi:hypothetical protein
MKSPDPLSVGCPSCEVDAYEYCVYLRGTRVGEPYGSSYYHTDRRIAAASYDSGQTDSTKFLSDIINKIGAEMAKLQGERDKLKDQLRRIGEILSED